MLPFPHLLLFLPACVFAGLAFTIAAITLIAETASRRTPAANPPVAEVPMRSAQIIYFRPRQTSLRSAHRVCNGG